MENLRPTGDFVGVGKPKGTVGAPEDASKEWPALDVNLRGRIVGWIDGYRAELLSNWMQCLSYRDQLLTFRSKASLPVIDPEGTIGGWGVREEQYVAQLGTIVWALIGYAKDVVDGHRPVAWDDSKSEAVIIGDESEQKVFVDSNSLVLDMKASMTGSVSGPGQVSGPELGVVVGLVILGIIGIAVTSVSVYATTKLVVGLLAERARERMQKQVIDFVEQQIKDGVPEAEAWKRGQALLAESAAARDAANKKDENDPFSKFLDTMKVGLYVAAGVGVLIVGSQLISGASKSRALARA